MVDTSTQTGRYLDMFHPPVKLEFPLEFEPDIDQKQPVKLVKLKCTNSVAKVFIKPPKIKTEEKDGAQCNGKRRGRPKKIEDSNKSPLINCGLCDFKAKNFREQEAHLKTHSDQTFFKCCHCKSTFSQKGNLIAHIRTHTKERPFKCKICDFSASQKINLQAHIRVHTKEKPFKCSICNFSTAQKCNLIAHCNRIHSNKEMMRSFKRSDTQKSTDPQFKYYQCGLCKFSCKLKKEIVKHVKLDH